jgi:hypothetical protein
MKNSYVVAVNLEDIDTGAVNLHQKAFDDCENKYEAAGRAVLYYLQNFGGSLIHSIDVQGFGGDDQDYIELIKAGRKIEAIKLYRERSGLGLRDAKMYIDSIKY